MSGFHDILFPIKMARGATGGPVRSTSVKTSASGKEARNTALYNSRRRYEISSKGSNIDELSEIIDFFEARMGRLYAFRFKDPLDNKSCAPSSVPSGMDQEIGTSDGAETAFQLVKKYGDAKGEYVRKITKPVLNSVIVSIDGLTISPTEYTVDYQTGSLTFNAAPTSGATIKAGYQFDIPVRFDNDALDFALDGFGAGHLSSIALLEVI